MKGNLLTLAIFFIGTISSSQDAKVILQKSFDKCQSVQNGYYEMTRYMKYMSGKDTSVSLINCHFKKLKDDTIYSSAFHCKYYRKGEYGGDAIYTGDDFVNTTTKDSTATIMSKSLWAKEIDSYAHNYKFYSPLTSRKSVPLQHDSILLDNKIMFKYISDENINDALCYHIQVNELPENDSISALKTLQHEFHYWIKKEDFIPVQYSISYELLMNNDTSYQYEKAVLNKYEINNLRDETPLTLNSIPSYYTIKDYAPFKSPKLLKIDTVAPNWELYSLTNEKISLKSLKGQLVLIDFFYKACYPCMQALPSLQALHQKYKSKGLRVIGIDPYDGKEDDMPTFLSKRGVTYSVLLGGKDAAKDYQVSGYPTIYLIDKKGKIIFVEVGYSNDLEETLEEVIKKNL